MTTPVYTAHEGATELVRLVTLRTAIADGFLKDSGPDWEQINSRWEMLSHGERAVLVLAAELDDVKVDTSAPGIYLVLERCDDSYRVSIANILANVLLP